MLDFNDTVLCGRKEICASDSFEELFCNASNGSHVRMQSVSLIYDPRCFLNV